MEHSLKMSHLKMHTLEGDKWKMVFQMCYNHFEYVVMPFGLTNELVVFQHLMNEYLDDFVVCYMNDILIFLKNMEDHKRQACFVLEKLWEIGLYAKLEKCEFHQSEMEFLGYIIFGDDIHILPCKVQTIIN